MGNSSITSLPAYSCSDIVNLSRNSVTPEYWESSSISDDFSANSTATAVIMLIFLLIGLPANTIIIISIIYQRLHKETTHILLLNLAISDLLVCVLVMPLTIVAGFAGEYVFGDSDYTRCQMCKTGLIFTALTMSSANILALISLDRFIFIKFPLHYYNYVTVLRVIVLVVIAWSLSILVAILPLFGIGEIRLTYSISSCLVTFIGNSKLLGLNIYYGVLLAGLALVPMITIITVNILVLCITQKQIRKVYRTRRSFGNKEDLKKYNETLRKQIHKRRNKKQMALIRAFGAILGAHFVVYTPLVIEIIILLIVDHNSVPLGIFTSVYLCLIIHSVLHPLIEGCFIPEIRMTFKKLFGIVFCQKLIRKRRAFSVSVKKSDENGGTSEDSTPTGSCLDNCSLALLPVSQA